MSDTVKGLCASKTLNVKRNRVCDRLKTALRMKQFGGHIVTALVCALMEEEDPSYPLRLMSLSREKSITKIP